MAMVVRISLTCLHSWASKSVIAVHPFGRYIATLDYSQDYVNSDLVAAYLPRFLNHSSDTVRT
jgi:hypothetical protein